MTVWKSVNAQLVRVWQKAVLSVRQVLKWVAEASCNQVGEAYLLHPRCCLTEHFQEKR